MEPTADEKELLYASVEGDLLIMQGLVWRVVRSDIDTIEANIEQCAAFLNCGDVPVRILPHPIISEGVPSCARCADILTR
jgi:hypothetical protein